MASTPAATEKVEMLKVLFAMSDPNEFGDADPFGAVAGGIEGMIGLLVSRDDVTVQQVPREKNLYSMLMLGQLAGQANLGVIEQLTLGNFVEGGFGDAMHEKYEKGFTSACCGNCGPPGSWFSKQFLRGERKKENERERKRQ